MSYWQCSLCPQRFFNVGDLVGKQIDRHNEYHTKRNVIWGTKDKPFQGNVNTTHGVPEWTLIVDGKKERTWFG